MNQIGTELLRARCVPMLPPRHGLKFNFPAAFSLLARNIACLLEERNDLSVRLAFQASRHFITNVANHFHRADLIFFAHTS